MTRVDEAAAIFHRAFRLRESLYRIFRAILLKKNAERLHLHVLNEELRLARAAERLVAQKDNFAWRWHAHDLSLDRVVWSVTRSAAELLTQGDLTRLRQCQGDDCGWILKARVEIAVVAGVTCETAAISRKSDDSVRARTRTPGQRNVAPFARGPN